MKHPNPEKIAADIGEDARTLLALLEEATGVQWQRSRTPSVEGDPGIRSKGLVNRPTEDAALDPLRLCLRAEVKTSTAAFLHAHRDLYRARVRLASALEAWRGDGI